MGNGCVICSIVTSVVIVILIFIFDAALNGDEEDYDYYYYDDDVDSTGPGGGKYSSSWIFGGGGRGGGGVGGSRLGGSRGGGNCFSDTTVVWTKNETSSDFSAHQVTVEHLKEGDLIGTLEISSSKNQRHELMWTRATDVSIYEGKWTAHSFQFKDYQILTVTSPHLMIIYKNDKFYFIEDMYVEVYLFTF